MLVQNDRCEAVIARPEGLLKSWLPIDADIEELISAIPDVGKASRLSLSLAETREERAQSSAR